MRHIVIIILLIFLTVLSSCNDSVEPKNNGAILIELKERPLNLADNIFKYLINTLTVAALGAGIFIGYPALRKKLREDHIKKLLEETQESNKQTKIACHKLIDKYHNRIYTQKNISKEDIQLLFDDFKELNELALSSSKEVISLSFYIKSTIQNLLRYYNPNKQYFFTDRQLYSLALIALHQIKFFAERRVTIPYNQKTKNVKYLIKDFDKYLSNNKYKKFKYFEQGIDYNPTSPIFISMFGAVHNSSNFLFHKSIYKIFSSPIPMARIMNSQKLYYPLVLENKDAVTNIFFESKLHLISFEKITTYSSDQKNRETVKFTYANIDDHLGFVDGLKKEMFEESFKDSYIDSKGIDLRNVISFKKGEQESITVEVDMDVANKIYAENRNILKRKMKSELKKNYTQQRL